MPMALKHAQPFEVIALQPLGDQLPGLDLGVEVDQQIPDLT